MPSISSLFVRKVVASANDSLDKPALLESMGLDPVEPSDIDVLVDGEAYLDLLEHLAKHEDGPVHFHLSAGGTMRCDEYGVLGLAFKAAPTLMDSFYRLERYGRLLVGESAYSVEADELGVWVKMNRGSFRYGLRLSNEAAMSTFWTLSKDSTGETFTPVAVHYAHSGPDTADHYEAFFGSPVKFDASFTGICFSPASAELPNRVGDRSIVQYFDQQLDQKLENTSDASSWRMLARDEVAKALSGGLPRVSDVASKLNVSDRTLQRRLADEGLSFRDIIEDTQRSLAKQLLAKTNYSLAEVAFMTGFSEQSAFNRAFKRWAGQTPRSYRLSV